MARNKRRWRQRYFDDFDYDEESERADRRKGSRRRREREDDDEFLDPWEVSPPEEDDRT